MILWWHQKDINMCIALLENQTAPISKAPCIPGYKELAFSFPTDGQLEVNKESWLF